jgi:electron transport complex protein RnfG
LGKNEVVHQRLYAKEVSVNRSLAITVGVFCTFALALISFARVEETSAGDATGNQKAEMTEALHEIFPSADRFESVDKGYVKYDVAYMGAERIGGAFYTEGKGYGGPMLVMVGIDSRGKVLQVLLLSHKETLGLWTKQDDEEFRAQFRGKKGPFILKREDSEGNLDGVTSATVTCRAIIAAVDEALRTFKQEWGVK